MERTGDNERDNGMHTHVSRVFASQVETFRSVPRFWKHLRGITRKIALDASELKNNDPPSFIIPSVADPPETLFPLTLLVSLFLFSFIHFQPEQGKRTVRFLSFNFTESRKFSFLRPPGPITRGVYADVAHVLR